MASVAFHIVIATVLLVNLPLPQTTPEKEQTVEVEMVPEPEKKPEPENKPEPEKKPEPESKPEQVPQPDSKPPVEEKSKAEEKPKPEVKPTVTPAQAKPEKLAAPAESAAPAKENERPAEKQAETIQPMALESAAKAGGTEAGGDRPLEPTQKTTTEPDPPPVIPPVEQETQKRPVQPAEKPVETPETARPPELSLPETANPDSTLNEGEAAIETVPKPVPKPVQKPLETPIEANGAKSRLAASSGPSSEQVRTQRPPSELPEVDELFSANALANPRVRQALGKLPANRRIVQICTIETLEQIRSARPDALPQGLVPFADGGGRISGPVLAATGGAYVSRGTWYDVSFECTVDDKVEKVAAFRFAVGKIVPEGERIARGLPKG